MITWLKIFALFNQAEGDRSCNKVLVPFTGTENNGTFRFIRALETAATAIGGSVDERNDCQSNNQNHELKDDKKRSVELRETAELVKILFFQIE